MNLDVRKKCGNCHYFISRTESLGVWKNDKIPDFFGDCTLMGKLNQGYEVNGDWKGCKGHTFRCLVTIFF